jgi:acyl-CoA dehydrogenase
VTATGSPAITHQDGTLAVQAILDGLGQAGQMLASEAVRADQTGTFPERSIELLRRHGLLAAGVPRQYGGSGLGVAALASIASKLGSYCGSTAMIWAMHQVQVACLARCASRERAIADYLRTATSEQHLIASATSEAGIGGDLRRSGAAVLPAGRSAVRLEKQATTVSYAEHADSILVTARSSEHAAPGDQVLVLVPAGRCQLERTSNWNMLGMRGTCSPGFLIKAVVPASHVLPEPFSAIAAQCMVPLSHLLWAATWTGIATDVARRAAASSKERMRTAARAGPASTDPRLGQMYHALAQIRDSLHQFMTDYGGWSAASGHPDDPALDDVRITLRANALKASVSAGAVRTAELALQICGMAGYSEEGKYSVARQFRDLHSAPLMISNSKLDQADSELLLMRETEIHS